MSKFFSISNSSNPNYVAQNSFSDLILIRTSFFPFNFLKQQIQGFGFLGAEMRAERLSKFYKLLLKSSRDVKTSVKLSSMNIDFKFFEYYFYKYQSNKF